MTDPRHDENKKNLSKKNNHQSRVDTFERELLQFLIKEQSASEIKQTETKNEASISSRHIALKNLTSEKRYIVNQTAKSRIEANIQTKLVFSIERTSAIILFEKELLKVDFII